jgi:GNAT superfamily N-acetyltransferase
MRIEGFRDFPYLYEGNFAYEEKYLEGYAKEARALLIRVLDGEDLAAVATATPLASSADIVAEAPERFAALGHDPAEFYYYAEILVKKAYRGRGIAERIYRERERLAREWGYKHLCLAVVQRPEAHPLRPADYKSPERIWVRDGFVKTTIEIAFSWPTILAPGKVEDRENPMTFWMRRL